VPTPVPSPAATSQPPAPGYLQWWQSMIPFMGAPGNPAQQPTTAPTPAG
jgi:hypothetical protein